MNSGKVTVKYIEPKFTTKSRSNKAGLYYFKGTIEKNGKESILEGNTLFDPEKHGPNILAYIRKRLGETNRTLKKSHQALSACWKTPQSFVARCLARSLS